MVSVMGKKHIILYVASSLDGFIARTNGDVDWLFSRNKNNVKDEHVTFVHEDVTEFIEQLSPKDDKKIWMVGGAMIIAEFLKHYLIDEFIISIHPVLLGNGIPLFKGISGEKKLKFIDVRTFDTSLVQVYYARNGT